MQDAQVRCCDITKVIHGGDFRGQLKSAADVISEKVLLTQTEAHQSFDKVKYRSLNN